jgi:hypothetical protein
MFALAATNRWCLTGTPIQVRDVFGAHVSLTPIRTEQD